MTDPRPHDHAMTSTVTGADWDALRSAVAGEVLLPESAGFELRRRPALARFSTARPAAVVRCREPADVGETLALARRSGVHVAVRSGGHCFAGRSSTDGVVVDVGPMSEVVVGDGVATIGAGARLSAVYDALEPQGVTIAAGCGPTVGIAGLTLGGGLGIHGRMRGLTSDQLLAARVVLADGRVVDCDEHHHGDLFWALRGAGGCQFGVCTSLTLRTVPATVAATLHLQWPHRDAVAVADAWQAWAPDAPDALAASLLVTAGADPAEPPRAHVFGAMIGGGGEATGLLDALVARVGAEPSSAEVLELPQRRAKAWLAEHGPGGEEPPDAHDFAKSAFFRRALPTATLAALIAHLAGDRTAGERRGLDFSPWGGAYNRVPENATAFAHRGERFLLKHDVAVSPDATVGQRRSARDWLVASWALVHPFGSGRVYPNFPDPDLVDWPTAYHGANLDRLVRVKAAYDPDHVFRFHQSLAWDTGRRGR